MSSDIYNIKLSRKGLDLFLDCQSTGAAGGYDYSMSRSFVLHALAWEARDSVLNKELVALGFETGWSDPAFFLEHTHKFIAWTRLLRRDNVATEEARSAYLGELNARDDVPDVLEALHARFPRHRFVIQARLTEERFGEGFPASFGTVAGDVVWDDSLNPPPRESAVSSNDGTTRRVTFANGYLSDLGVSNDRRQIFARLRLGFSRSYAGDTDGFEAIGDGDVVALDATTFEEKRHLSLDGLRRRDGHLKQIDFVRHAPDGSSIVVVLWEGPALLYSLGDGQAGAKLTTFPATRTGQFSGVAFDPASVGVLVHRLHEIELTDGSLRWPGVRARSVTIDDTRIAFIGDKTFGVFDRVANKELFRLKVTSPCSAALLSEGRTALLSGGWKREALHIHAADGSEIESIPAKGSYVMMASPAGLIAITGSGPISLYDPDQRTMVTLDLGDHADVLWIDEAHLATISYDRRTLSIFDVNAEIEKARVATAKAHADAEARAAARAAVKAGFAPAKSDAPLFRDKVKAALLALRKRKIKPSYANVGRKFAPPLYYRHVPSEFAAYMADACITEVGWIDAGAAPVSTSRYVDCDTIRAAQPGQHYLLIDGSAFSNSRHWQRLFGVSDPDAPGAKEITVNGAPADKETFVQKYRPYVFYGEHWYAVALDLSSVLRAGRDMHDWTDDPRSLQALLDDALAWLANG